jgi:hypothetical protein
MTDEQVRVMRANIEAHYQNALAALQDRQNLVDRYAREHDIERRVEAEKSRSYWQGRVDGLWHARTEAGIR